MTISSSLNAGVMGLRVNSTRLAAISDNIANSATYGYKRSEVDFSSMVITQRSSIYSAGGVRATAYKEVDSSGSLISTSNALDIAVNGNGMIPVTDIFGIEKTGATRDFMMVPTGGFSPDENGNLRTASGLYLLGWPTDSNGTVQTGSRDSASGLVPVNVDISQFSASPTRNLGLGVNLPADSTDVGGTGEAFTLPVEYFDNLGRAQTLTYTFTPNVADPVGPPIVGANTWSVSVSDGAGDPAVSIANFDMEFSNAAGTGGTISAITNLAGGGVAYDSVTGDMTFNVESGPMTAFIGRPFENTGITQLAAPYAPTNVTKDGSPIGDLQAVEIDQQGQVEAIFSSGFRRVLFQIPVVDVPNLNGLEAVNNQAYKLSQDSGDLYLWDAGTGSVGGYSSYALMESATDIASELTGLIETQRAYSSNAKIIQTVDEMLQETTNLKR